MNQNDFSKFVNETFATVNQLLVVKGGEYAGSEDRLANFKRGAGLTGTTPLQCAFIYASKHYDAIATFIRDQAAGTERPRSESIEGRLDDLLNYCLLMKALVRESHGPFAAESHGSIPQERSAAAGEVQDRPPWDGSSRAKRPSFDNPLETRAETLTRFQRDIDSGKAG